MRSALATSLFLLFFLPSMAMAQQVVQAKNEPGKLIKDGTAAQYVSSFKAMPAARARSFAGTVNGVLREVYEMKILNPPTGFDVKTGLFAGRDHLHLKEPYARVYCFFRYKVKKNGALQTSLDGADLFFEMNAFDEFFDQVGNFWEECHKDHFPLFFEQIPMTDSTDDYIELNFKNYGFPSTSNNLTGSPIRIVTANHRPLIIPLTRKEFVRFLIARENRRIKENEKLIADEKKGLANAKDDIDNPLLKQETKDILKNALPSYEAQIKKLQNEQENMRKKIAHFSAMINDMSPAEAAAPARLDENKLSADIFGLEQLVPVGRREGVLLTKLNPQYYDASPNAPAVQLITVYYTWPDGFRSGGRDYLQDATVEVFDNLDYHKLKESMR